MVTQGFTVTLVAATLAISRSSLYYRKRPRGSRADRTYDEQIVVACGGKPAYGYRRVAWWLRRKENLPVNRKRVLRVMRERGLLVRSRRLRARRKKEWGRVEAAGPNQIWQSDMTKVWAGPAVGWVYLVCVIDCCTREFVGWNLSHRCRTEDALAAVEQAVLERLPAGSREENLTLTTDNGTQFTSLRFLETLRRLGITHRRTAYHPPGRQQLYRTVPSQLERGGSLDGGVSELGRSACLDRSLDQGVQSRPASPRSRKSHAA
jgi:transposase InsO family protein